MTIRQMQAFAAVCQEGSATKAAKKLFTVQSAVSRALRDLSKQYDTQFFENVGGKLKPTDAALQLLDEVNEALRHISAIEDKLNSKDFTPILSIGCNMEIGTSIMLKAVTEFEKIYKQTKLYVFENSTAEIEFKLLTGELDFGLVVGNINNVRIVEECLVEEEFFWVCSPDNPIADEEGVNFARLAEEKLILPGPNIGIIEIIKQHTLKQRIELKPMWATGNAVTMLNAVLTAGYVSYLSWNIVAEYVKAGKLKIISTTMTDTRKICAVYLRGKSLSPKARTFIDICTSLASAKLIGSSTHMMDFNDNLVQHEKGD